MSSKAYAKWLTIQNKQIHDELKRYTVEELEGAFGGTLSFGTAGLRGIMGFGTNRMNVVNVCKLANAVLAYFKKKNLKKIVIGFDTRHNSKTTAWSGKNWVAFGDSITAITNGNGLNLGWAAYVNSHYGFNNFYGRGVGGQSFIWNANTFYANTDGTYAGRYGQQGLTSAPKGTTEHKGCFSSWDRIKTMIPDSIKNTIDFVFIMGGTNDIGTFSDRIKWTTPNFNAQNVTDTDWLNASEYNGGDYDVNTFSGAICSAIMKMQIRCPNAIIVIGTPLAKWVDKNAYSKNGVTMEDVADIMIKTARYMSIPYIDVNGTCGINGFNYTKYITDGTHPYCDAGYRMLARTINGGLKNILPHDNGGV